MVQTITIKEALNKPNAILIDTRTPKEFAEDHIPNAINLPILSNDERAIVGTIYKQQSKEEAIEKGVALFSKRLPDFMKTISQYKDTTIIVNCWRGGMRSKTVVALLDSLGYTVLQLVGGYKSYRHYVKETLYNFQLNSQLIVLCGLTCTGKTELLQQLPNSIDLEGLAQHRSSIYGAVGLQPRSQKRFESLLLLKLQKLQNEKTIFIEGESRRIGDLMIPEFLWKKMRAGIFVKITRSLANRTDAAVKEYMDSEEKINQTVAITKTLNKVISKKRKEEIIALLEQKQYHNAITILLTDYYDPLYSHTLKDIQFNTEINNDNLKETLKLLQERFQ